MQKLNGALLRKKRQDKGLTVMELSELLEQKGINVDWSSIARWERLPTSKPRQKSLQALCEILEINPNEIYIEEPDNKAENVDLIQLIEMLISVSKRDPSKLVKVKKILLEVLK